MSLVKSCLKKMLCQLINEKRTNRPMSTEAGMWMSKDKPRHSWKDRLVRVGVFFLTHRLRLSSWRILARVVVYRSTTQLALVQSRRQFATPGDRKSNVNQLTHHVPSITWNQLYLHDLSKATHVVFLALAIGGETLLSVILLFSTVQIGNNFLHHNDLYVTLF